MKSLSDMELRRREIMRELEEFVTVHNHHGLFGTARRFQRALIELSNCAPVIPFPPHKSGSRKRP